MKPSNVLLLRHKNLYPLKFQHILPLRLKDSVSGKSDKQADQSCIQEMTILLTCLKENEFNQGSCSQEINQLKDCYTSYMANKRHAESNDNKVIPYARKNDLNFKQLNKILKNFPNPK